MTLWTRLEINSAFVLVHDGERVTGDAHPLRKSGGPPTEFRARLLTKTWRELRLSLVIEGHKRTVECGIPQSLRAEMFSAIRRSMATMTASSVSGAAFPSLSNARLTEYWDAGIDRRPATLAELSAMIWMEIKIQDS
jgi:hypothetical protein